MHFYRSVYIGVMIVGNMNKGPKLEIFFAM